MTVSLFPPPLDGDLEAAFEAWRALSGNAGKTPTEYLESITPLHLRPDVDAGGTEFESAEYYTAIGRDRPLGLGSELAHPLGTRCTVYNFTDENDVVLLSLDYSVQEDGAGKAWAPAESYGVEGIVAVERARIDVLEPLVEYIREWDSPERHGYADGGTQAEKTAAMQAWASSLVPDKVYSGSYTIDAELALLPVATVHGHGLITGIHASGFVVNVEGAIGSSLGQASGTIGSRTLSVVDSSDFSVGDMVFLYDSADFSYSLYKTFYRAGEIVEVLSIVDATTITLQNALLDTYSAGTVEAYVCTPALFDWRGDVTSSGNADPFRAAYTRDSRIAGTFDGGANRAVLVDRSLRTEVDAIATCRAPASGTQYGLSLASTQYPTVRGRYYGTRHGITHGSFDGAGAGPCRGSVISAQIGNDSSAGLCSGDTHGNCDNITWVNCTFDGGLNMGGRSTTVRDCTIGSAGPQSVFHVSQFSGGKILIEGGLISVNNTAVGGLFDGGINTTRFTTDMVEDLDLVFRNVQINFNAAGGAFPIYLRQRGTTKAINLTIEGVTLKGSAPDIVAAMNSIDVANDPGRSDGVVAQGMRREAGPMSASPVFFQATAFPNTPKRIQATGAI